MISKIIKELKIKNLLWQEIKSSILDDPNEHIYLFSRRMPEDWQSAEAYRECESQLNLDCGLIEDEIDKGDFAAARETSFLTNNAVHLIMTVIR